MDPEGLENVFDNVFAGISQVRGTFTPHLKPREVGAITSIATGIAKVSGLPGVGYDELVKFPGDLLGIAFNVDEDELGVVLLGDYWHLHAGDEVERTGRVMDVGVGDGLLGRVIDPLGRPLDGKGPVSASERLPIERPAAPIMDRAPVTVPLQTGLKVIDSLIPIGRGQRELILGDRQTGKTAIAIDAILNQRGQDVVCVYCAIGQRASGVAKAVAILREKGAMGHTVVVVTEGNDPPGLTYIAPYAATSIAEHFMEAGRDVLIVYDDLTQHARAYRELSLLLRRPPGREAFPGDIFYIHSRLLERATHLRTELGGGSLTALPIIETEAQNISAYIPTNLISITDGQIYLSPSLFEMGVLPAVDVGKSVSRVGGKAQRAAYRAVAGDLKLAYAQFEELETFVRFGARLDEATRKIIEHGRRIRACLKQSELAPVPVPGQIAILLALTADLFDPVPIDQMTDAEHAVNEAAATIPEEVCARLNTAEKLSDEDRATIVEIARTALAGFQPKPESKPEAKAASKAETKVETTPDHESQPDGRTEVKPRPKAIRAVKAGEMLDQASAGGVSIRWRLAAALVILAFAGGWLAVHYLTQKVEPRSVVRSLTAGGVVVPTTTAPVGARVSGTIQAVYCVANMTVKAGQLCAKIDPRPYQVVVDRDMADLAAAKTRLEKDKADLARAKAAFDRHEALRKRRAISRKALERARKAYEQMQTQTQLEEATVAQLQAALNTAETNVGYTDIISPIDGTVVSRNVEMDQTVAVGAETPLFLVAADSTVLQVNAKLTQKDIGEVKLGDKASLTVQTLPNRSFAGEVTQISRSPAILQNVATYDVVISVPNPDLLLKPGMNATVNIVIDRPITSSAPIKERS